MGWTGHDLPDEKWELFTRGGTCGVFIQKVGKKGGMSKGERIEIPSGLIRKLVAEDIRSEKMDELESMDTDKILGLKKSV